MRRFAALQRTQAKAATRVQRALGVLFARDTQALTRPLARDLERILADLADATADAYLESIGEPKARKAPREIPPPPETWPIIEREPEHIPDVPPDLKALEPGELMIAVDRLLARMDFNAWLQLVSVRFQAHYERVGSHTVRTINDALDLDASLTEPSLAAIRREGAQRTRLLDLPGDTRRSVLRAIEEGTEAGKNPRVVARDIRDQVGAGRFVHAGPKYRAELIARTETLHAQRLSQLAAYASSPVVTAVVALDGDQDPDCAARNGREFTFAAAALEEEHPAGTLCWTPVVG